MFLKTVPILGLFLIASVSGCLGGDGGSKDASSTTTAGSTTGAAGGNGTGGNGTGSGPVAIIKVLSNGTEIAAVNGSLPVTAGVNVTFDGSNSTGATAHAWDFGDGNTSDQPQAVYMYSAAGNFTVTLTVSDEAGVTNTSSVMLTVAAGGPAPGTPLGEVKKTFPGSYTVGVQQDTCTGKTNGVAHSFTHDVIVPAAKDGATVGVSKIVVVLTGSTTVVDQAFRLVGPDGKTMKDQDAGSDNGESLTLEDEYKSGKYSITVYACAAVSGSYSLTATLSMVAI